MQCYHNLYRWLAITLVDHLRDPVCCGAEATPSSFQPSELGEVSQLILSPIVVSRKKCNNSIYPEMFNIKHHDRATLLGVTFQSNSKCSKHVKAKLCEAEKCLFRIIRVLRKEGYGRGKQLQLSHYAFEPHWLLKSNKIFWVALIVVIYNKNWRILYVVHHRVEQNLWSTWVYWWRFFLAWIAFAILSHQDTGEVHGTNGIWSIAPWIWGISGKVDSSAKNSSYKSVHDVINELIVWFMCSAALKALLKRLAFSCIVKAKILK